MINYEKIYNEVLKYSYGYSIGNIWQSVDVSMKDMNEPYEIRKDIFFKILEKLMKEEHIKLALNGHFLQGTIAQQLQSIKDTWPTYPSEDELDDLDDIGLWFLAKCPAGLVWFPPDGQEIWT